jgi:hypothetical protein
VKILRNWGGGDDGHQWRASHYCVDPGEHHPGQVKQVASSQPTRPEAGGEDVEAAAQAKAAERRRVIDNNKDWRAAVLTAPSQALAEALSGGGSGG